MVKHFWFPILLATALVACPNPQSQSVVDIDASAEPSKKYLGLLEVRIVGIGGSTAPAASANFIDAQRLTKDPQTRAITSVADPNVILSRLSVAFVDINDAASTTDFNTTGAIRYVTATFNITNNTTTNFDNLSLHATSVPPGVGNPTAPNGTIGGTQFYSIQLGTGVALSNSIPADVALAQKIVPATGVGITATGVTPENGMTDFQIFTAAEASTVKTQVAAFVPTLDVDPLQFGYVARNLSSGRVIPIGGTGRVTVAFKLPKINPRSANPFAMSFYFVVTNDTSQFISQSAEEQGADLFNSNLDTLTTNVRTLEGSRLVYRDDLQPACGIQTAFVRSGATSVFYNPAKGTSTTAFGSTINDLDCLFGASGRRATTFGANDIVAGMVNNTDTMYIVGTTGTAPNRDIAIWSVLVDGTPNTAFNTTGKMIIDFGGDDVAASIARDTSSGGTADLYVAATNGTSPNRNFAIARVNLNGTLDTAFDTDGKQTYDINLDDQANDMVVQPNDGRIVVVGTNFAVAGNADFTVLRATATGALDATFGSGGSGKLTFSFGADDIATSVTIDSNNKIIIGGYTNAPGTNDFAVARLTTAGALDTTFSLDGLNTASFGGDDRVWDVAVYPSSDVTNAGRIVAVGQWDGNIASDFAAVRFAVDGSLDTTFGSGSFPGTGKFNANFASSTCCGGIEFARAVSLDSSGRVYITGYTNSIVSGTPAGGNDIGVMRLTPLGALDTSFDADGKLTVDINTTNDQSSASLIDSRADLMIAGTVVNALSDFAVIRIQE